ncbi:hypothetical protein KAR48_02565 [bacterium]|nr:hypothetical protein [bacterium]
MHLRKIQLVPRRSVDSMGPAGSINSSVIEMAQWVRLQLGNGAIDRKQLIKLESMKEMHSPQQIISSFKQWTSDPRVSLSKSG